MIGAVLLFGTVIARADINIVASTPNLAMLARTIGGESVQVRSLTSGERELQFVEFRPSMMTAMRPAMLLVTLGAPEEARFVPIAIRSSNNTRVEPGQTGHFVAGEHVRLLAHPVDAAGGEETRFNPHFTLDPEQMVEAGRALAERMAVIRPGRAAEFRANAEAFAREVNNRMPAWRRQAQGAPGVLPYHVDADYLLAALNVPIHGYVQRRVTELPEAEHLADLMMSLRETQGVIWFTKPQPIGAGEVLARQMKWPLHHIQASLDINGTSNDYFELIDALVAALR